MEDELRKEAERLLGLILETTDKDLKLKATVMLLKYTFRTQKRVLVAVRDVIKNKISLGSEEVHAIQGTVESLIGGINLISKVFDKILTNEYKVN